MINNVVLVGRLTKDPELKMTPSGIAVCRFSLAVNRPFTNNGERKADFINCIAWRKQAENLANFMRKGGLIGITGRIETGSFEGQDGKRVYTTDVVADSIQFLESKNAGGGQQAPQQPTYTQPQQTGYTQPQQTGYIQTPINDDPFVGNEVPKQSVNISEDDLPF